MNHCPGCVCEMKNEGVEDPLGEWALDMEATLERVRGLIVEHLSGSEESAQTYFGQALRLIDQALSYKPEEAKAVHSSGGGRDSDTTRAQRIEDAAWDGLNPQSRGGGSE